MYLVASVYLPVSFFFRALQAELFRGSALSIAAKSKEESLSVQGVCLCVE